MAEAQQAQASDALAEVQQSAHAKIVETRDALGLDSRYAKAPSRSFEGDANKASAQERRCALFTPTR